MGGIDTFPSEPSDDPIPLSALQHAVYCLRQAALIHVERVWADNRFTAEGHVLHAVADKVGSRKARGLRRVMALPLASRRLNVTGVADVVEFLPGTDGETAFPIEYKRGKPKLHRADEVQLCAQALCLEEMTGRPVPEGALFYAETKRRVVVPFDVELRNLAEETLAALAAVLASGRTPPPTPRRERCRACSLLDLCRPDTVARPVKAWRSRMVERCLGETP
ncbi:MULTISPECIES: CRISPR-associated protein Cas4 [unclassified Shinella]|jgi:CRISPR-associated exonuclease Cas4|uniref:CRISPR-associated protein Cas4 n=1 Tax=unclassified Shinella TaxID=2643062 RepID=UPI00234EE374|nr:MULTISPECIES: CRISPR-associated protein Cas4 [unclassified Shinella]MCO5153538.1 CRISPR-associated protein Cas4 [Shinella sp.]MDC7265789.1 CRISPR-associated protein Cas4 [Shinella sp. HY16]MDC7272686.1 CRISPR-associated protein Cas4 [Shinella sp. YZ44]